MLLAQPPTDAARSRSIPLSLMTPPKQGVQAITRTLASVQQVEHLQNAEGLQARPHPSRRIPARASATGGSPRRIRLPIHPRDWPAQGIGGKFERPVTPASRAVAGLGAGTYALVSNPR